MTNNNLSLDTSAQTKDQLFMIHLFKNNSHLTSIYKKFGTVMARLAKVGEEIVTLIDGKVETKNTAKENDVIVKGLKDEEYIIGHDKFKLRYSVDKPVTDTFTAYEPNGTCIAYEYTGASFLFKAPWDEDMIVNHGDFLATIDESVPEVYRIERNAFFKTYKKVVDLNDDENSVILSTN